MKKQKKTRAQSLIENSNVGLILEIFQEQFGHYPPFLNELFSDIDALYKGKWPTHEACQVGYHTYNHALEVALASARMAAGWNKIKPDQRINEQIFMIGTAAALLHDSGYIKDKGDNKGKGGKYTYTHVKRSMDLAKKYLVAKKWPKKTINSVQRIISITEFNEPPHLEGLFQDGLEEVMAKMVASADIIAQMSDVDYIHHINDLFDEFQEAYSIGSREAMKKRGLKKFGSAQELIDGTREFYINFVLPRLGQLGGMDKYLIPFFGEGRNPYLENIDANLSGLPREERIKWRRLGEILEELGMASKKQIKEALAVQKKANAPNGHRTKRLAGPFKKQVLDWVERLFTSKFLGDIMLESRDINATALREALMDQILPAEYVSRLNKSELLYLMRFFVLLQNIHNGAWVFDQVMTLINELLRCEASSILLANPDAKRMHIVFPSGPKKDYIKDRTIALDRGLASWVYLQGRPAIVTNVQIDNRFNSSLDKKIDFQTKSILAVPLMLGGECVGVLEVINKEDDIFTEHDMNLLTIVSNIISNSLSGTLWLQ